MNLTCEAVFDLELTDGGGSTYVIPCEKEATVILWDENKSYEGNDGDYGYFCRECALAIYGTTEGQ